MATNYKKLKNGISYDLNGWKYISVKGKPRERGYSMGYFVAEEFKKIQKIINKRIRSRLTKQLKTEKKN